MMERLTKGNSETAWYKGEYKGKKLLFEPYEVMSDCSSIDIGKILRRLAYYEDMEEQGRLVVLPCKIGSKVYVVEDICYWDDDSRKYCTDKVILPRFVMSYLDTQLIERELGKTVFLTREDAERALAGKVCEQVQDAIDKHNREAMRKIAAFIEPKEGADHGTA